MPSSNIVKEHWKFIFVLLLASVLRFANLHHGIGTTEDNFGLYNGDEVFTMNGLQAMDPTTLNFNPKSGMNEGAFGYYMWLTMASVMRVTGIVDHYPHETKAGDPDYNKIAYAGRALVAICDLGVVLLVYLCLIKILGSINFATLGALFITITPYEILMAQELRPHMISNFWGMLIIYVSLGLYEKLSISRVVLLGVLVAVVAATRYHIATVLLFPSLILLGAHFYNSEIKILSFKQKLLSFIKMNAILILSFVLAYMFTNPYLVFHFETIKPHLQYMTSYVSTSEFTPMSQFFNLHRLRAYLSVAIPFGASYFLWVIFYFAFIHCLFLKKHYRFTLPIIFFSLVYLFIIPKVYYFIREAPSVRAVLLLFPLFSILSAISLFEIYKAAAGRRLIKYTLNALLAAIIITTLIVCCGYLSLVGRRNDINLTTYEYFKNLKNPKPLRVGYVKTGRDYIITPFYYLWGKNVIELVDQKDKFEKSLQEEFIDKTPELDYIFLNNFYDEPTEIVNKLLASNKYNLRKYSQAIDIQIGSGIFKLPYPKERLPLDFPFVHNYHIFEVKK